MDKCFSCGKEGEGFVDEIMVQRGGLRDGVRFSAKQCPECDARNHAALYDMMEAIAPGSSEQFRRRDMEPHK